MLNEIADRCPTMPSIYRSCSTIYAKGIDLCDSTLYDLIVGWGRSLVDEHQAPDRRRMQTTCKSGMYIIRGLCNPGGQEGFPVYSVRARGASLHALLAATVAGYEVRDLWAKVRPRKVPEHNCIC